MTKLKKKEVIITKTNGFFEEPFQILLFERVQKIQESLYRYMEPKADYVKK